MKRCAARSPDVGQPTAAVLGQGYNSGTITDDIGDTVQFYYDPRYAGGEPQEILIDRGAWIWTNPAFLLLGGIALLALGLLLARRPRGA